MSNEIIKQHFDEEAKIYDGLILKLIPYYEEMINAMISAVPFPKEKPIKVVDLGCGTGTVAQKIKEAFPRALICCLDLSENMLNIAKDKLKSYTNITFKNGDFQSLKFDGKYDAIVSSLALHHLETDEDKKAFYAKIYSALTENGVFYNADLNLGSSGYLQSVYIDKWKEFMSKNATMDEIVNKWLVKYEEEDHPSEMVKQLKWLEDIGFKNVDVIWKYYNFAVYGGQKK